MIHDFYHLTKPGIVRGNAMTAAAGFLLASKGDINLLTLLATVVGLSFVIASACVFNNYIDRDIDKKMTRTKNRALVTGSISTANAIAYATVLLCLGLGLLNAYANLLTALIALLGFFAYVVLYGYFKRHSVYGTEVGSISGAVPPVVGYCAVTNNIDSGAIILFLVLVFWQMPHFYAIGIRRITDYKAASIPIFPIIKGVHATKIRALAYTSAFTVTIPFLFIFGYAGYSYLVVMTSLAAVWLFRGVKGFKSKDDNKWAGNMFGFSLLVLTTFSFMISLSAWLP